MAEDVFEKLSVASFTIRGVKESFPIVSISERSGHRLAKRARPYRNGVKVDGTGAQEVVWIVEAVFENSIEEDGLESGRPLYPQVCNALCDAKDYNETGDLVLPTRGKVRARLESYDRRESAEERDGARVSFTFVQDNEDNLDAQAFNNPTALARVTRDVDDARFSTESLGGFTAMLDELETAAADLEEAIAAPGEWVQDVDQKVAKVVRITQGVEDQFVRTGTLGRDLLLDPDSWATVRQLSILKDRTHSAVQEKNPFRVKYVTKRYRTTRSLLDIAVAEGINPVALIAMNPHLDPLSVRAGEGVRVPEKAA